MNAVELLAIWSDNNVKINVSYTRNYYIRLDIAKILIPT
jgi:hypothetical protein